MADVPPNHTIYINNLNEKVKKEGLLAKKFVIILFPIFSKIFPVKFRIVCRVEEGTTRDIFSIWPDNRYIRMEDAADARTSVRRLQGDCVGEQRHAIHAGIPLLR